MTVLATSLRFTTVEGYVTHHSICSFLALSFVLGIEPHVRGDQPSPATIDFPGASSTQSWGINSRGEIVGFYISADNATHGFVLRWNQFRTIDFPDATTTSAYAINDRGEIAGSYAGTDRVTHGFVWCRGRFKTVDFPGAVSTEALGINERGEIVAITVLPAQHHAAQLERMDFC
jgi:uncharacterized membrane protein